MGQAKNRGSYEERRNQAIERDKKKQELMRQVITRRRSPKMDSTIAMLLALKNYEITVRKI